MDDKGGRKDNDSDIDGDNDSELIVILMVIKDREGDRYVDSDGDIQ